MDNTAVRPFSFFFEEVLTTVIERGIVYIELWDVCAM
jgi:hypothetical protein